MEVIGHKKITDFLDKSSQKGSLHHAYLFSGPEHVGKFTVALDFARKILRNTAEINPDLLIIRPEVEEKKGKTKKKAISVENIREMQKMISTSPASGKYKIVIIDEAQHLNISAQNAILKTLEEPPSGVILILISSNQKKFLPTIISRCIVKKFNLASREEIAGMIPEGSNKEEIIFWSLGRPGLAKIFLEEPEKLKEKKEMLKELENIAHSSVSDRFLAAEEMSKDGIKLAEKMGLWVVIFREIIFGNRIIDISSEKAFRLLEKTEESLKNIRETNSNSRLILENLMLEF